MTFPQNTAAVIGTGFIGVVHVEALHRSGIRVKGILGSSPGKSKSAARILGLAKGYASYEELLSDPEVEVVHITTPSSSFIVRSTSVSREEDFSRPKLFAGFDDGHQELLLWEAILRNHREETWRW
jgi:Oxidoreductase family, NAD-binding Rossmann fold